jgi:8-oxo-dGTP diphosphatase
MERGRGCFTSGVRPVHTISTLLYCFNEQDEVLLMERAREPNLGLWSPPGGKLLVEEGESPHTCACREALEELEIIAQPKDFHLTGIVTESHFSGRDHWLMFLFELNWKLKNAPPEHREGRFEFFSRAALNDLKMPTGDRTGIWPMFWKNRGGFFSARWEIREAGAHNWIIEEGRDGNTNR